MEFKKNRRLVSMIVEYVCGSSLHDINVMTTLNFMINMITLMIVLLKRPIHIVEDTGLSDLQMTIENQTEMLEYLALIAENELLRIENEKYKNLRCTRITTKGTQCKNKLDPLSCPWSVQSATKVKRSVVSLVDMDFVRECTRSWYMKGKSSCPMCRVIYVFQRNYKIKERVVPGET
jgi:hypothetical protein